MAKECNELDISFEYLHKEPIGQVLEIIEKKQIGGLVVDFLPLRSAVQWLEDLKNKLPETIPICQVINNICNIIACTISTVFHS